MQMPKKANENGEKTSTMIENELKNLEKIKARQKREVLLMIE
jgi:hypothetical protein